MDRRGFIIIGTGSLAAISIPTACSFFGKVEYDPSLAKPESLSLIWDPSATKSIGKKYLLANDESERTLVNQILEGAPTKKEELNDFINQKIKSDFQLGNTIDVDGWILSVTEARQCALLSMQPSN